MIIIQKDNISNIFVNQIWFCSQSENYGIIVSVSVKISHCQCSFIFAHVNYRDLLRQISALQTAIIVDINTMLSGNKLFVYANSDYIWQTVSINVNDI